MKDFGHKNAFYLTTAECVSDSIEYYVNSNRFTISFNVMRVIYEIIYHYVNNHSRESNDTNDHNNYISVENNLVSFLMVNDIHTFRGYELKLHFYFWMFTFGSSSLSMNSFQWRNDLDAVNLKLYYFNTFHAGNLQN